MANQIPSTEIPFASLVTMVGLEWFWVFRELCGPLDSAAGFFRGSWIGDGGVLQRQFSLQPHRSMEDSDSGQLLW